MRGRVSLSASQHIEWVNLVEKTGPFLAVGVLDEAFPQGLVKVETRKRQRVRSAYEEWRDAVDAETDPQLRTLYTARWVRLVLEELLEFEASRSEIGVTRSARHAHLSRTTLRRGGETRLCGGFRRQCPVAHRPLRARLRPLRSAGRRHVDGFAH